MADRQDSPEVARMMEVAARVASARAKGGIAQRREGTPTSWGPAFWADAVNAYGARRLAQEKDAWQEGLDAGGDEEAGFRASAGRAMLAASRELGERELSNPSLAFTFENAVSNLLHAADEAGLDPFEVLAEGLDRYSNLIPDEDDM